MSIITGVSLEVLKVGLPVKHGVKRMGIDVRGSTAPGRAARVPTTQPERRDMSEQLAGKRSEGAALAA